MVWLEPLFYFIYFAKNRIWAEGGHFRKGTENGVYSIPLYCERRTRRKSTMDSPIPV